jgi:hypothetical protein
MTFTFAIIQIYQTQVIVIWDIPFYILPLLIHQSKQKTFWQDLIILW